MKFIRVLKAYSEEDAKNEVRKLIKEYKNEESSKIPDEYKHLRVPYVYKDDILYSIHSRLKETVFEHMITEYEIKQILREFGHFDLFEHLPEYERIYAEKEGNEIFIFDDWN